MTNWTDADIENAKRNNPDLAKRNPIEGVCRKCHHQHSSWFEDSEGIICDWCLNNLPCPASTIAPQSTREGSKAQGGNNLPISEADWQKTLIDLLHVYGYLVHAERPARNQKGWVTPIQGDAGFIDIVAAKIGRLIFIECKSRIGKLSEKQEDWRRVLILSGVEYILARPQDYDYLVEHLK